MELYRRFHYVIITGVCLFFIVLYITVMHHSTEFGYPFDDSWIHLLYAKNMILYHTIGLNPGDWNSGTTSYLWVILILCFSLCNFYLLPYGPVVVGTLAYIGTCIVVYIILKDLFKKARTSLLLTLLIAMSPLLIFWSLSGLEVTLFLMLSLLTIYLTAKKQYKYAFLCCAALVFLRPESTLLYPVILFAYYLHNRKHLRHTKKRYLLAPLFGVLYFFLLNYMIGKDLLNSTFAGRRLLWVGANVPLDFSHFVPYIKSEYVFFKSILVLYPLYYKQFHFLIPYAAGLIIMLLVGGLILYIYHLFKRQSAFYWIFLVWFLVHNLFYIYFLPTRGHLGRYQPENAFLLYFLIFLSLFFIMKRKQLLVRSFGYFLTSVIMLFWLMASPFWLDIYTLSVQHINSVHKQLGKYINSHTPIESKIAVYDIGVTGFYANRRLVDISCLNDKECVNLTNHHNLLVYFLTKQPQYLAMPEYSERTAFIGGLYSDMEKSGIEKKQIVTFDFHNWADNLVTWNALPRISLYKLTYTAKTGIIQEQRE